MRMRNSIIQILALGLICGGCASTPTPGDPTSSVQSVNEVSLDFCFRQDDCQAGFVCRYPSICSRPGYGTCVGTCQPADSCPVVDPTGPCVDGCCGQGAVCVGGNCFGIPG